MLHRSIYMYRRVGIYDVCSRWVTILMYEVPMDGLCNFVARWEFPKGDSFTAKSNFTVAELTKMFKDGDHFKGSASSGLTAYPIVALWLQTLVPTDVCIPQVASYMALADVLDILQSIKHGAVTFDMLNKAIPHHLNLFKAAYNTIGIKPKHHMAMHLPGMFKKFTTLLGRRDYINSEQTIYGVRNQYIYIYTYGHMYVLYSQHI